MQAKVDRQQRQNVKVMSSIQMSSHQRQWFEDSQKSITVSVDDVPLQTPK